ncbi:MAG: DUF839 domain-containing protein [Cyanothece sp. SIO1E1]|nr:DUF839 domain-containing protein [Cyanothece sp. SIO1E1]
MSKLTRRQLLIFFGSSAAATALSPQITRGLTGRNPSLALAQSAGAAGFTPIRLPHPLPIYQTEASFLPTGVGTSTLLGPETDPKLTSYTVVDDVTVPPEFERYVIVSWGDFVFPNSEAYVGYNNDYTAFVPLNGNPNDGLLWINHEFVSFPFSDLAPATPSSLAGSPITFEDVTGFPLPSTLELEVLGEFMYNIGGSIIRITRTRGGRFEVNPSFALNRRIHALSGLGINAERTDGFETITAWGSRSTQIGDDEFLEGTGPAVTDVFPLSSDGLGNRIIGTGFNCSGGTTPWGTVVSAEENFQSSSTFFVGVQEKVKPDGTQLGFIPGTTGATFGLVGEKYGWMVEINLLDPTVRAKKHTALGRFRHENIAFRIAAGEPLVAYMGDDREGGHTWKFVSAGTITSPTDPANSALFEEGTLFAARFNPDGTGVWVPLLLSTPTAPIAPTLLAELALENDIPPDSNGNLQLPQRIGIGGATEDGGSFVVDLDNEAEVLPQYLGQTVGDFYPTLGAALSDAFLAGNLIGGTPTSRPEDIEVNPANNDVIIAYTDHDPSGDGHQDSRIFQTTKISAAVDAQITIGAFFKIVEDSANGAGTTFTWEELLASGEAGAENGAGFAAIDNLAFDPKNNVWVVTDMSTSLQNGFGTGAEPSEVTVDHTITGDATTLAGVYGNNWMFVIPTSGPLAGEVVPFAYGPPRCEMTGPTFIGDTLILAVQHPGESVPLNNGSPSPLLNRDIEVLDLGGKLFSQSRTVPLGSSWPSNLPVADGGSGDPFGPPKPAVIGIRRIDGGALI